MKFGLKKELGLTTPPPRADNVPFFYRFFKMRASLTLLCLLTIVELGNQLPVSMQGAVKVPCLRLSPEHSHPKIGYLAKTFAMNKPGFEL